MDDSLVRAGITVATAVILARIVTGVFRLGPTAQFLAMGAAGLVTAGGAYAYRVTRPDTRETVGARRPR